MFRVTKARPQFGHVHSSRSVRRPGGRTSPPSTWATICSILRPRVLALRASSRKRLSSRRCEAGSRPHFAEAPATPSSAAARSPGGLTGSGPRGRMSTVTVSPTFTPVAARRPPGTYRMWPPGLTGMRVALNSAPSSLPVTRIRPWLANGRNSALTLPGTSRNGLGPRCCTVALKRTMPSLLRREKPPDKDSNRPTADWFRQAQPDAPAPPGRHHSPDFMTAATSRSSSSTTRSARRPG